MKIVTLISCASSKLEHRAPARDLYDSDLFRKSRAWAEWMSPAWFVVSAKHRLLHPDEVVEPYDCSWADLKKQGFNPQQFQAYKENWAVLVGMKLLEFLGITLSGPGAYPYNTEPYFLNLLMGKDYYEPLSRWLVSMGFAFWIPTAGMGIGQQKSFLLQRDPLLKLECYRQTQGRVWKGWEPTRYLDTAWRDEVSLSDEEDDV